MYEEKRIYSQIIKYLKECEYGRFELSINKAVFYNWKKKYGGIEASLLKRFKELEEEKPYAKSHVCGPEF